MIGWGVLLTVFLAILLASIVESRFIKLAPAAGASTVSASVEETCLDYVKRKYPGISGVTG